MDLDWICAHILNAKTMHHTLCIKWVYSYTSIYILLPQLVCAPVECARQSRNSDQTRDTRIVSRARHHRYCTVRIFVRTKPQCARAIKLIAKRHHPRTIHTKHLYIVIFSQFQATSALRRVQFISRKSFGREFRCDGTCFMRNSELDV